MTDKTKKKAKVQRKPRSAKAKVFRAVNSKTGEVSFIRCFRAPDAKRKAMESFAGTITVTELTGDGVLQAGVSGEMKDVIDLTV